MDDRLLTLFEVIGLQEQEVTILKQISVEERVSNTEFNNTLDLVNEDTDLNLDLTELTNYKQNTNDEILDIVIKPEDVNEPVYTNYEKPIGSAINNDVISKFSPAEPDEDDTIISDIINKSKNVTDSTNDTPDFTEDIEGTKQTNDSADTEGVCKFDKEFTEISGLKSFNQPVDEDKLIADTDVKDVNNFTASELKIDKHKVDKENLIDEMLHKGIIFEGKRLSSRAPFDFSFSDNSLDVIDFEDIEIENENKKKSRTRFKLPKFGLF